MTGSGQPEKNVLVMR